MQRPGQVRNRQVGGVDIGASSASLAPHTAATVQRQTSSIAMTRYFVAAFGLACFAAVVCSPEMLEIVSTAFAALQTSFARWLASSMEEAAVSEGLYAGAAATVSTLAAESVTPQLAGSTLLGLAQGVAQFAIAHPLATTALMLLSQVEWSQAEIVVEQPAADMTSPPGVELGNIEFNCLEAFSGMVGDVFCQVQKGTASELTTNSVVTSYPLEGTTRSILADGNVLYVTSYFEGVSIYNASDPEHLVKITEYNSLSNPYGLYKLGARLYVADWSDGVVVLDVSNPSAPSLLGSYDTSGNAYGVLVSGSIAYVADRTYLEIVDFSNPASPVLLASEASIDARDVALDGNTLYATGRGSGLFSLDISTPSSPVVLDTYDSPGLLDSVALSGDYAIAADGTNGVLVISKLNPSNLTLTGSCSIPSGDAVFVEVVGQIAYVADDKGAAHVIDFNIPSAPFIAGTYLTPDAANVVLPFNQYLLVGGEGDTGVVVIKQSKVGLGGTPDSDNIGVHKMAVQVRDSSGQFAESKFTFTTNTPPRVRRVPGKLSLFPGNKFEAVFDDNILDADGQFLEQSITLADGGALPSWLKVKKLPMHKTGSLALPASAVAVVVEGATSYVGTQSNGIHAVNIGDPNNPRLEVTFTGISAYFMVARGRTVFAIDNGLSAVDFSDVNSVSIVSTHVTPVSTYFTCIAFANDARTMVIVGYDANPQYSVKVLNVENPASISEYASLVVPFEVVSIAVSGELAAVGNANHGVQLIDINDLKNPVNKAIYPPDSISNGKVFLDSGRVFIFGEDVIVVDVTNSSNPVYMGRRDFSGNQAALNAYVQRDNIFVSNVGAVNVLNAANASNLVMTDTVKVNGPVYSAVALKGDYVFACYTDSSDNTVFVSLNRNSKLGMEANPPEDAAGNYPLVLTATDTLGAKAFIGGLSAPSDFVLRVEGKPFVASVPGPWIAKVGEPFNKFVPASSFGDPNGDLRQLSAEPHGAVEFNSASGAFIGRFRESDTGVQSLTVYASDGIVPGRATMAIQVKVDHAPVVALPLPNFVQNFNVTFNLTTADGFDVKRAFFDADGDALSKALTLSNGQPVPSDAGGTYLLFGPNGAWLAGRFTDASDVRAWDFKVSADDGKEGVVSDVFTITISRFAEQVEALPRVIAIVGRALSGPSASVVNYFSNPSPGGLSFSVRISNADSLPRWLGFVGGAYNGIPGTADVVRDASDHLQPQQMIVRVENDDRGAIEASQELLVDTPPHATRQVDNQVSNLRTSVDVDVDVFADNDLGDHVTYRATGAEGAQMPAGLELVNKRIVGAVNVTSDPVVEVIGTDTHGAATKVPVLFSFFAYPSGIDRPLEIAEVGGRLAVDWSGACQSNNGEVITYGITLQGGGAVPESFDLNPVSGAATWPTGDAVLTADDIDEYAYVISCRTPRGGEASANAYVRVIQKPSVDLALPDIRYVDLNQPFSITFLRVFKDDAVMNISISMSVTPPAPQLTMSHQGPDVHLGGELNVEQEHTLLFTATDFDGYKASASTRVFGLPFPKAGNIPRQVADVNQRLQLQLADYFQVESTTQVASYALSMADGSEKPSWLSVGLRDGVVTAVAPFSNTGLPPVVATVAYGVGGISNASSFTLIAQYPPAAAALTDQIEDLGASFLYEKRGIFSDPDGLAGLVFGYRDAAPWMVVEFTVSDGEVVLRVTGTVNMTSTSHPVFSVVDPYGKHAETGMTVRTFAYPTVSAFDRLVAPTGAESAFNLLQYFQSNGQGELRITVNAATNEVPVGVTVSGGVLRWAPSNSQIGTSVLEVEGVAQSGAVARHTFELEGRQLPRVGEVVPARSIAYTDEPWSVFVAAPFNGDGFVRTSIISNPVLSGLQVHSVLGNTTLWGVFSSQMDIQLTWDGTDDRNEIAIQHSELIILQRPTSRPIPRQVLEPGEQRVIQLSEYLPNPTKKDARYSVALEDGSPVPGFANNLIVTTGAWTLSPTVRAVNLQPMVATLTLMQGGASLGVTSSTSVDVIASEPPRLVGNIDHKLARLNASFLLPPTVVFSYWGDLNDLRLIANGVPTWASHGFDISTGSAVFSMNGDPSDPGVSRISLWAIGPYNRSTDVLSFNIESLEFPAVIADRAGSQTIEAGQVFRKDLSQMFTNPGRESRSYEVSDSDGFSSTPAFSFNPATGQIEWTTPAVNLGLKTFTATVTTAKGATATGTFGTNILVYPSVSSEVIAPYRQSAYGTPLRVFVANPFVSGSPLTISMEVAPAAPWLQMSSVPGNTTVYSVLDSRVEERYRVTLRGVAMGADGASAERSFEVYRHPPLEVIQASAERQVINSDTDIADPRGRMSIQLSSMLRNPAQMMSTAFGLGLLPQATQPGDDLSAANILQRPNFVSFNSLTGDGGGRPSNADAGTYHLVGWIESRDQHVQPAIVNTAYATAEVVVNAFPKVGSLMQRIIANKGVPLEPVQFIAPFLDANGANTLHVTQAGLPSWGEMNYTVNAANELVISVWGTPPLGDPSVIDVSTATFVASDHIASAEQDLQIVSMVRPSLIPADPASPRWPATIPTDELFEADYSQMVNRGGSTGLRFTLSGANNLNPAPTLGEQGGFRWLPSVAQSRAAAYPLTVTVASVDYPTASFSFNPAYIIEQFPEAVPDKFAANYIAPTGDLFVLTAENAFTDNDINSLRVTMSIVVSPNAIPGSPTDTSWLRMVSATAQNITVVGRPTFEQRYDVRWTATDTGGATAMQASSVYVVPTPTVVVNPETGVPIANQLVNVGDTLEIRGGSALHSSALGVSASYSVAQADGSPAPSFFTFGLDGSTGLMRVDALRTNTGTYHLRLTLRNDANLEASTTVMVSFDHFPTARSIEDQLGNRGQPYSFNQVVVLDEDGASDLNCMLSGLPAWASFTLTANGAEMSLSFAGAPDITATNDIETRCTDPQGASVTAAVRLRTYKFAEVSADAPTAPLLAAVGKPFRLSVSSYFDVQSTNPIDHFVLSARPGSSIPTNWLRWDRTNGVATGTPTSSDVRTSSLTATAKDVHGAETLLHLDIEALHEPVVSNPPSPMVVREGRMLDRAIRADTCTDAGNRDIAYMVDPASQGFPGIRFHPWNRSFVGYFPTAIQVDLSLLCSNGKLSASFTVVLKATENAPPRVLTPPSKLEAETDKRTVWAINMGETFVDDNRDHLTPYLDVNAPSWLSVGNNNTAIIAQPTMDDGTFSGFSMFEQPLFVRDGSGSSVFVKVTVELTGYSFWRRFMNGILAYGGSFGTAIYLYRKRYIFFNMANQQARTLPDEIIQVGQNFAIELTYEKSGKVARVYAIKERHRRFLCCCKLTCLPKADFEGQLPTWLTYNAATNTLYGRPNEQAVTAGKRRISAATRDLSTLEQCIAKVKGVSGTMQVCCSSKGKARNHILGRRVRQSREVNFDAPLMFAVVDVDGFLKERRRLHVVMLDGETWQGRRLLDIQAKAGAVGAQMSFKSGSSGAAGGSVEMTGVSAHMAQQARGWKSKATGGTSEGSGLKGSAADAGNAGSTMLEGSAAASESARGTILEGSAAASASAVRAPSTRALGRKRRVSKAGMPPSSAAGAAKHLEGSAGRGKRVEIMGAEPVRGASAAGVRIDAAGGGDVGPVGALEAGGVRVAMGVDSDAKAGSAAANAGWLKQINGRNGDSTAVVHTNPLAAHSHARMTGPGVFGRAPGSGASVPPSPPPSAATANGAAVKGRQPSAGAPVAF